MKTILKGRIEYINKSNQLDGPTVEWSNGTKFWFVDGKLHRLDGPAIEWDNGDKHWYVEGYRYSEIEFMHKFYPVKNQNI